MENGSKIFAIAKESKEQKWPFPKTFEELKNAGVLSYQVEIENCDRIYTTSAGKVFEAKPEGFQTLKIADSFSKQDIIDSLQRVREKKTDYFGFLKDIAASGVHHYIVNMNDRSVIYFNKTGSQSHKEYVPEWRQ
jgi:uncharacterized protein YbcV (DUF1398 family)